MAEDKYIVARIELDEDEYMNICTWKGPYYSLDRAKMELRMSARTHSQIWPSKGEDDLEDYFDKDHTSWGDIPGDRKRTRFIILKTSPGFTVKVIS